MVIKRNIAKNQLQQLGIKVASAISKNTNILIAGEKAGFKLKKAEELGIVRLQGKMSFYDGRAR